MFRSILPALPALLALVWASSGTASTLALHVVPLAPPDSSAACGAPVAGVPCDQFTTAAAPGAVYDVYVVAVGGDSSGIAGARFGIDYFPATPGSGTLVQSWTSCADLQAPADGALGAWPAPTSGNALTWSGPCPSGVLAGSESEGERLVLGVFTVTSYTADSFVLAPHPGPGTRLSYTNCSGAETPVPENQTGFIRFSPSAAEPGGNPCDPGSDLDWVEESTPSLPELFVPKGVSLTDYDGDGDVDAFFGGSPCLLFRNDGTGLLENVTPPTLAVEIESGIWGDYDNDGDLDLYGGGAGPEYLLRNDGGILEDVTTFPLGSAGWAYGPSWIDLDADGDLDLYVAASGTSNPLFRNDGNDVFVEDTPSELHDPQSGRCAAWADYDDDGDMDVFVVNRSYTNWLFRNDGSLVFSDVSAPPLWSGDWSHGAVWGDYDNDGDLDVYVTNDASQSNQLYRNEGEGVFSDVSAPPVDARGRARSACWGDIDNDGDLDIFLGNSSNNSSPVTNKLFRNDGNGVFADISSGPMTDLAGAEGSALADLDGDGDLDIVVNKGFPPRGPRVIRNRGDNGNHWIEVALRGVQSNRNGVGARITLTAGGTTQIREVTTCAGFRAQGPFPAHFGLGPEATVQELTVVWPSGVVQETTMVAGDQRIVLWERDVQLATELGHPGTVRMLPPAPNPFLAATAVSFFLPDPDRIELSVYDLSGRRIRVLDPGTRRGAGSHRVVWDGRSDGGREMGSGIYFFRIRGAGFLETRKAIKLR